MRVVLATSPHVRHAAVLQSDFTPDRTTMYSFAPVGLLSLAAVLRTTRPELECELYDLNRRILSGAIPLDGSLYSAVAFDVCANSPHVVGFMTECDSYHHVLQIAAAIKHLKPDTHVVLGGPHASAVAHPTLERCDAVDAIVVGEGERTFPELLDALRAGVTAGVAGAIVRRRGPGSRNEIIEGGPRELVEQLDDLPMPAYDLHHAEADEEIFVEVGRGCPFQCAFCSTAPYWNRRHRVKSPARVLSEVLYVRELFDAKRVHFTHDLFTTDKRWVRAVCETLVDAGTPVRWTCSARTDTVDEPLLELMSRAGCDAIYFGIESGSQRILQEIHKDVPLEHSFEMLRACARAEITPNAGFIVGFPSEDATSARESFVAYERALRLGCRPAHLFAFCPFAQASIYASLDALACNGHFIDLPLGRSVDDANRGIVASDRELYGAYFRPPIELVPEQPSALWAVDEFSPLVEAALFPTLALSALSGGLYEVFRRWLEWIGAHNESRGAAPYRRWYGTPATFAAFVRDELLAGADAPKDAVAAARAVELNLRVVEQIAPVAATTMASHRSLVVPPVEQLDEVRLATRVSGRNLLATLEIDYDVTPALSGRAGGRLALEPTYLVWQLTATSNVRLLRVDRLVFDLLDLLGTRSVTIADLVLEKAAAARDSVVDAEQLFEAASVASREGLVAL